MAFRPKNKDSIWNVICVSVVLCLVCSAVVSVAAVTLRPRQLENEKLAKQRNRLLAADLVSADADSDEIGRVYKERIRTQWLNLETGEPTEPPAPGTKPYDFEAAADDASLSRKIPAEYLVPGRAPNLVPVYQVLSADGGSVDKLILPVSGKGLWSTLRAYLAVDVNLDEPSPQKRFPIAGVTFYEQAETAGLGAEVENAVWQQDWRGRYLFGEDPEGGWKPEFKVAKPAQKGGEGSDEAQYQVDALAGATITGKGVEDMINFWLSDYAFGEYLRRLSPELMTIDRVSPEQEEAMMLKDADRSAN